MKNKNRAGFTLIELLVVIAIISLLSSIVFASLNSARAKARDAKRVVDVKQLATALQLYFNDNDSFPSNTSCLNGWCCLGHGDAGTCWTSASGYHGSTALDNSLSPKYISKISDDPLNNTSRYGDAYMYRIDSDANGVYATLHWGIESSNPNSQTCAGGTWNNWGAGAGIGGNYYCMLIVR
ncbi:MAG: type II secretion system protein [bacterium]|nr:type II secretion system protein [bacterium]